VKQPIYVPVKLVTSWSKQTSKNAVTHPKHTYIYFLSLFMCPCIWHKHS